MANPNIVGVVAIYGKINPLAVTTTPTAIVSNALASGKLLRVNTLLIANIDGVNSADITVDFYRSSTATKFANTIVVPADATLTLLTKDILLNLEEGDSIRVTASADNKLTALCSYEEVS